MDVNENPDQNLDLQLNLIPQYGHLLEAYILAHLGLAPKKAVFRVRKGIYLIISAHILRLTRILKCCVSKL